MPVLHVGLASQINFGDVTMLSQKRPSLATMAKLAIDNYFLVELCVQNNASNPRSCDVTDQLWWRHNAKLGKTVLSGNGEISDRWLFLAELWIQDIK